jgi:zinc/manganese transport system ATP-binding protein
VNTNLCQRAVELSRVTLALGKHTVLHEVTLSIKQGEFIGVLGPNGAGKTTLMRALLGLIAPRTGTIRVFGANTTRGNAAIGYMPQTYGAQTRQRLCGFDFVACAASGYRWGLPWLDQKARRSVERALALVDASELARRSLADLSSGERQRLLLSIALLDKPRLLLLDEPLASLDPPHQKSIVDLVRQIQQQFNITVLFSAHELNPLLHALDRVLYLGGGKAALGSVDEVITSPMLSRLYGAAIDVLHIGGRIFVMSGGVEIEKVGHRRHV